MATQYLILVGKAAAAAQNEAWWAKVLGRAKLAQDITSMLFKIIGHPTNGTALVYVTDAELALLSPKLIPAEQNTFNVNVKQESDPAVVQFKADVLTAFPVRP